MVWRPPLVAEAIDLAAAVSGCDPASFHDLERWEQLETALEDTHRQPADAPIQQRVAWQIARFCDALLAPGLFLEPSRVAEALLSTTLSRSGYGWKADGLSTVMALQSWSRRPGPLRALADWAETNVDIPASSYASSPNWAAKLQRRGPDVPLQRDWVLDHDGDARFPGIYVAGPLAQLETGSAPHMEIVRDDVARGLDIALDWLELSTQVRLLHPSTVREGNNPGKPWSDAEWLKLSYQWLVEEADGFIVTDVAQRAPGFGAGVESHLYGSAQGPALIILDPNCAGHSRFEQGLAPHLRGTVETLPEQGGVSELVAQWTIDNFERVLASWRHRRNIRCCYHESHQEILSLVTTSASSDLAIAARRSGLSAQQLRSVLNSAEGMGATPWRQVETLRMSLRHQAREPTNAQPEPNRTPNLDLSFLAAAAKTRGWTTDETTSLLVSAERELASAGADHRLVLDSPEAWMALHARLYGSH